MVIIILTLSVGGPYKLMMPVHKGTHKEKGMCSHAHSHHTKIS